MPTKMSQKEFERRVKEYTNDSIEVISPYINRRSSVTVRCKKCQYEWSFAASSIMPNNVGKHSFKGCPECKYEEVECSYCHKKFKRLKS